MTIQKIFNLNVKSNYSLLKSCLSIKSIVNYALENQWEYVSLIDINNMYGALDFYHQATNNHLKPIIGLEITIVNYKYLLVALNYDGYLELVKISSQILTNQLVEKKDLLVKNCAIIGVGFVPDFQIPNIYTTLVGYENTIAIKESYYENNLESYLCYQAMQAIDKGKEFDYEFLKNQFNVQFSIVTDNDNIFVETYKNSLGFKNLNHLLSQINWVMPHDNNHMVKFPLDQNIDHFDYLKQKCLSFLKNYFQVKNILNHQIYLDRLNYELDVIRSKNFVDYFLVVADFIEYARKNKILIGPGRGSAAGSLVAFCLQITKIDSIKYNLLFERFLNPSRSNMPDIDTDVMDKARDNIVNYLFQKYGNKNVGLITTFQNFKAKMAIRDVGKLLKIDAKTIDIVAKSFDSTADDSILEFVKKFPQIKKFYDSYPHWFQIANSLINAPRQVSTHAAGIVLSDVALDTVCPITIGLNNHIATQYAWNYLEEIGLIKMDILGLRNLSIIDTILKIIFLLTKTEIELDQIPLDDKATYQLLSEGKTNGIFQLESPGMKKLVIQIKPQSIEDIAMINALFRPGPLNHIKEFINVRNNIQSPSYLNPILKQVLASTYGIILYQEQVIKIVQLVAQFDASKADIFRKAISKKDESKMINLKEEFIDGAIKNNFNLETANKIYNYIFDFANYGFNHSHAIAYSIISYWMAYLKTHYPIAFFVALLTDGDNSKEKILSYVNEACEMGIQFQGPDINLSNNYFSISQNKIIFSFLSIAGIGKETANKIIEIRNQQEDKKFNNPYHAIASLINGGINQKVVQSLIQIGAFDSLKVNRNTLLFNWDEILNKSIFFDKKTQKSYFDVSIVEQPDWTNKQKSEIEIKLLGINLTNNNFNELFNKYQNLYHLVNINQISSNPANVLGLLNKITIRTSQKTKQKFANLSWTINNKLITIMINLQEKNNMKFNILQENQCYIISIVKSLKSDTYYLKNIITEVE